MIRKLMQNENSEALTLAREVFSQYEAPDYPEEGVKTFYAFLENNAQTDALTFYGAFLENRLIGMLAMRGENHIALFFVKDELHGKGFGRKLFELALQNSGADRITVNSSPCAVGFYHRLGFTPVAPGQTKDGIRFTPMTLDRTQPPAKLPDDLAALLDGYTCTQNRVGCSSAGVYRYSGGAGSLYLKTDKSGGGLRREQEILRWLEGKLPVPKIRYWGEQDGFCHMLTSEAKGHMACVCPEDTLCEPYESTVKLLADGLRMLQSVDITGCPFDSTLDKKLADALYNIENNLVDMDDFEEGNDFSSPMELYRYLSFNKPPEDLCFTHGDYCLPNIFLDHGSVTGFIDVGRGGIADKWQDIALCVRSLGYNLRNVKEKEQYLNLLFDCLNSKPDWDKINYYILLDELF